MDKTKEKTISDRVELDAELDLFRTDHHHRRPDRLMKGVSDKIGYDKAGMIVKIVTVVLLIIWVIVVLTRTD